MNSRRRRGMLIWPSPCENLQWIKPETAGQPATGRLGGRPRVERRRAPHSAWGGRTAVSDAGFTSRDMWPTSA
jgi:hypothetical protein